MPRNVNPKLWKAAVEASEDHIMRTYRELEGLWKAGAIKVPGLKTKSCKDPSKCSCEACSHKHHGHPAKKRKARRCTTGKCPTRR